METWALLLTAIGAGGIITKLVDNVIAWLKGRQAEQRDAWTERDKEARARRVLEEYAHRLRRMLFRRGAREGDGEDDVPPWPTY